MKILVLGHKGWIGSMMCNLLKERNIDYIVSEWGYESVQGV